MRSEESPSACCKRIGVGLRGGADAARYAVDDDAVFLKPVGEAPNHSKYYASTLNYSQNEVNCVSFSIVHELSHAIGRKIGISRLKPSVCFAASV